MGKALIICRSQTEALKCQRLLIGAGVAGVLTKPSRREGMGSCCWAVRVAEDSLPTVRRRLLEKNFEPLEMVAERQAQSKGRAGG